MLKHLLLGLWLSVFSLSAAASPQTAKLWGTTASDLRTETAAHIASIDLGQPLILSDTFALNVYRFGRTSGELAKWIDGTNGPNDLGCIFRGMSAEAEFQLEALEQAETATLQREALRRLTSMFADAEMIASAAQNRSPTPTLMPQTEKKSCQVDAQHVLQALN